MSKKSPIASLVSSIKKLPKPLQKSALTFLVRRTVKFVGTAKLDIIEMTAEKVHVKVSNRKIVQNHIGGVHAAAMALLAETATGFVAGMSIPADRLPLLKSMEVNYVKRAKGDLEAVATLDKAAIEMIKKEEKGEIVVPVVVTDEDGNSPIEAKMIWAWIPKKRK